MEALLRAARPPPRRPMWSVAECALFTARRDYELLWLVANDKKALQAARRLGFFRSHFQADPHPAATASGAAAATSSTDAGVAPAQPSGARAHRSRRAAPRARPDVGHPQPQPPQPAAAAGGAATAVVSSRDRPADGTSARAGNQCEAASECRAQRAAASSAAAVRPQPRVGCTLRTQTAAARSFATRPAGCGRAERRQQRRAVPRREARHR